MKRDRSESVDSAGSGDHTNEHHLAKPGSLVRTVSPPPLLRRTVLQTKSATAAVEAGEKHVEDHLEFYSSHLQAATRPNNDGHFRLSHAEWIDLYTRNAGNDRGCHFVVHQHDHPVAGTHYDLRLQCNATSSISFAIMYGLPGDPNSRRLNRNATETRVHCLWNHLIETASHATGTMLLWDTGEYEILPYHKTTAEVSDESAQSDDGDVPVEATSQQQKLRQAFGGRKVRLRLHGTRLPEGYTLSLRLTKDNYRAEQPNPPSRRRRRVAPQPKRSVDITDPEDSSSDGDDQPSLHKTVSSLSRTASPPARKSSNTKHIFGELATAATASDDEDEKTRLNNAYPGAVNDVGSVHQRRWYLSLDRPGSGFVKRTYRRKHGETETKWLRKDTVNPARSSYNRRPQGFNRFWVQGRDVERSVVTGRLAREVLKDEGVQDYVPRGLWRAVTE